MRIIAPPESDINAEAATACTAPRNVSAFAVLACAWPALLLATACLLPFLNKPFLIDDPHFLMMAQQIVKHPAHPMDFDICWNGPDLCTKAYLLTPGNALMGYVLVPTVLGGAHEWAAHLTQLVLVWIAIVAMASLVLRLGWDRRHALAGAMLLVAIPPFLPMASTAMPDILATAVALVAIERLAAWKAEQRWSQGVAAAIALGLAGFARSHLALLLPLAAFFLLDSLNPRETLVQIRRRFWLWIPVLAGACLLTVIILAVREHNLGISPPSAAANGENLGRNLFAYLLYMAFPLPLVACWLVNRFKTGRWMTIIIVLAVALLPWIFPPSRPLAASCSFAILGCSALCSLLLDALEKRDHTALFFLLWLLIPLPIVFYLHLPIKYLLPCIPAVIFLCFRLMEGVSFQIARTAALVAIFAYTGYSVLILRSDNEFAQIGRNSLYELISPHVAAGEQVWYPGNYWSYWYAPLAGARLTYPGGPQPKPGDLLVEDVFSGGDDSIARFPDRTLVETIRYKYRFGRTMGAGIGLYTNGRGYWLWGFGEDPNDRYELWRID
jgi:dolichyl-phosphate-mannose-protein mannosyltransferase